MSFSADFWAFNMFEGKVDMTNARVYTARKLRTENLSLSILPDHLSLSHCNRVLLKMFKTWKSSLIITKLFFENLV